MSDTVQYKMETMTEELDEMIRVKLFSIEEVRYVVLPHFPQFLSATVLEQ